MCYTLVYAPVCCTGTDAAAVDLAVIMYLALLLFSACSACVAAPGSLARYETLAALGCACAAAHEECCFAIRCCGLVLRSCARRDRMVGCFTARCSGLGLRCCARRVRMVPGTLLCYLLHCVVPGGLLPAGLLLYIAAARAEIMSYCNGRFTAA